MSFTSGLVEHQGQLAQEEVILEKGHDQQYVWNWRKKLLTWINSTHGKGTRGFLEILVSRENLSLGYNAYTSKPLVTAYLQHMVVSPKRLDISLGCRTSIRINLVDIQPLLVFQTSLRDTPTLPVLCPLLPRPPCRGNPPVTGRA